MAPIIESFIRLQSGDEAGHKTAITSLRLGIISGEDGEAAATRVQSHYDVTEAAGRVIPRHREADVSSVGGRSVVAS